MGIGDTGIAGHGGVCAGPLLRTNWRGELRKLRSRGESGGGGETPGHRGYRQLPAYVARNT